LHSAALGGIVTYIERLAEKFVKIESLSQTCFTASTFKNKTNRDKQAKSTWRVVHKINFDEHSSICTDTDIKEELIWKLLDNRTYFNVCRCCALLCHVDSMHDQVCVQCLEKNTNVAQWAETSLINSYIKPYRIELAAICSEVLNELPESFEDCDSDVLGLACCNLVWDKPHGATAIWKVVKQFDKSVSKNDSHSISQATKAILYNRNYFHFCLFCGQFDHKDHLSGRMCYSCMHTIHGVMF
jgi:hypothetical protein